MNSQTILQVTISEGNPEDLFTSLPSVFSINKASIGYMIIDRVGGLSGGPNFWRLTLRGAKNKMAEGIGQSVLKRRRPIVKIES